MTHHQIQKQEIKKNESQNIQLIQTREAAHQLCARLIDLTSELISLLDRETQLMKKPKSDEIAALALKKQALSSSLMKDMAAFRHNVAYIKMAAPDQVELLQDQQKQFQRSIEINHRTLTAMKSFSEQLLQIIARKVGQRNSGPEVYGRDAGMANPGTGNSGAISIDTTL